MTSEMMHLSPSSPRRREDKRRMSSISLLLIILGIAIVVFAVTPIFIHHSVGIQQSTTNNAPHHLIHQLQSKDLNKNNIPLPPDIGEAGRFLLLNALKKRPVWDDKLDTDIETERCRRYFTYHNNTNQFSDYKGRKRRRLFLGSLIADDSWHALGALSMETYGIYTAVAFVESNRTQTGTPRKLRFVNGSLEHEILFESNLFGPNTQVMLEQFSFEGTGPIGGHLIREQMQRALIIDMWKKAGMTPYDIGVLTDADETPTRDFLRAAQTCEFPHLDPATQNCHTAKLIACSKVFEGSPECMTITRDWMHPDMILGKCIEGIGDDEFKLDWKTQRMRQFAWRKAPYTVKYTNYSGWPKEKKTFPLWNAADFRRDQGGHVIIFEFVDYLKFGMGHTGYHFHNYFGTIQQLRNKYLTYGHPIEGAGNMSIGEMHPDLDSMVDCVLNRNASENKHKVLSISLKEFAEKGGRIPVAYELEGYSMARQRELKEILLKDEVGHERTWHDNPKSDNWYTNNKAPYPK